MSDDNHGQHRWGFVLLATVLAAIVTWRNCAPKFQPAKAVGLSESNSNWHDKEILPNMGDNHTVGASLGQTIKTRLGSLQGLVGLNVVLLGYFFIFQWLYASSYYFIFRLEPEQVGVTTQYLVVRAGVAFLGFVTVVAGASAILYVRERRGGGGSKGRMSLLFVGLIAAGGPLLYNFNTYGEWRFDGGNYGGAAVALLAAIVASYLILTGVMRDRARRFYVGVIAVAIIAVGNLVFQFLSGRIDAQRIRDMVIKGEYQSEYYAPSMGVPTSVHTLVEYKAEGFNDERLKNSCGLFLGSNSGTTYVYGGIVISRSENELVIGFKTIGLPTDSTIMKSCDFVENGDG